MRSQYENEQVWHIFHSKFPKVRVSAISVSDVDQGKPVTHWGQDKMAGIS